MLAKLNNYRKTYTSTTQSLVHLVHYTRKKAHRRSTCRWNKSHCAATAIALRLRLFFLKVPIEKGQKAPINAVKSCIWRHNRKDVQRRSEPIQRTSTELSRRSFTTFSRIVAAVPTARKLLANFRFSAFSTVLILRLRHLLRLTLYHLNHRSATTEVHTHTRAHLA